MQILTFHFLPTVLPISGGAGISPWGHGSGIMSISRWEATRAALQSSSAYCHRLAADGLLARGKLELCPMGRVFRCAAGGGKAVPIALA